MQTNITFLMPSLLIGGVELVLLRTLRELSTKKDISLSVILNEPITAQQFIDFFNLHPNINVVVCYKWLHLFKKLEKWTNFFPAKNIRKCIYGLYKKYCIFKVKHNTVYKNADVLIDYKNFNFYHWLKGSKKIKIGWFHGGIDCFNEYDFIKKVGIYDKIVCLSDSFLIDFTHQYPEYAEIINRIYNPIDCEEIQEKSCHERPDYGNYFCVVSRLDVDKDIKTVILGFNKFLLQEKKQDIYLLIVGSGSSLSELQAFANTQECRNNIIFVGEKQIPFGYMRGAIAHILSSYSEGLPTVLIEAQSVGTLNISSNCKSGVAEILLDGDAGILFEPGNADELANALSDVWNGRVDTKQMIQNATKSLARFEPKSIADEIIKLVNELKGEK